MILLRITLANDVEVVRTNDRFGRNAGGL
jgi:hypothetical protein